MPRCSVQVCVHRLDFGSPLHTSIIIIDDSIIKIYMYCVPWYYVELIYQNCTENRQTALYIFFATIIIRQQLLYIVVNNVYYFLFVRTFLLSTRSTIDRSSTFPLYYVSEWQGSLTQKSSECQSRLKKERLGILGPWG